MKLAKNEKIIKKWPYAHVMNGVVDAECNLIVTNKRLISEKISKREISKVEVNLDAIKGLSVYRGAKSNFWPIVGIIFCIPLCFAIIGIPLLVKCIKLLNQGMFDLDLITDGTYKGVAGVAKLFAPVNKGKVRIKIKKDVCTEVVDTLGAILLDKSADDAEEDEETAE